MKSKKLNLKLLWIQFADVLYPRLRLSITDRAVYFYLLRHTRLEGRLELHCSMPWIARGLGISAGPVRESVRRLAVLGALCLVQRSKAGHVLEVRLPEEIPAARPGEIAVCDDPVNASPSANLTPFVKLNPPTDLEKLDFLKTRALRNSIHLRERGHCFYCLRRTDAHTQCLDHVKPRVKAGCNSYRNLVSCCLECNSLKGERPAADFLRWLFRDRRLTASELHARLRALDALAAGKLPPPVQHPDTPVYPACPEPRGEVRGAGTASSSRLPRAGAKGHSSLATAVQKAARVFRSAGFQPALLPRSFVSFLPLAIVLASAPRDALAFTRAPKPVILAGQSDLFLRVVFLRVGLRSEESRPHRAVLAR